MFALYFLGRVLEPGIGTPRFVALYFASLFAGSFGALLLDRPLAGHGRRLGRGLRHLRRHLRDRPRPGHRRARLLELGVLLVINLALTFGDPQHQRRRPPRRPRRRPALRACRSSPANAACSAAAALRDRARRRWPRSAAISSPPRSPSPEAAAQVDRCASAARSSAKPMLPGGSTRSGWRRWPSSSTPSTSRGPGREKVEAASTAKTRPAPSAATRSQCSSACARAPLDVPAAGHRDDDVGAERRTSAPHSTSGRLQARRPGDVLAAGDRDHLRHPVAADVGRVEPLERDHPRARLAPTDGAADRRQPALELAAQLVRRGLDPGRLAEPDHVLEHLAEACSGPAGGPAGWLGQPRRPRRRTSS